ncbi:MAG: hypothetical protein ACRDJK_02750, partial [Actinomycetota bacterium]
ALVIGMALVEAATHFEYRLPEVFAGYPRSVTDVPVDSPTAARPQSAGAGRGQPVGQGHPGAR